MFEKYVNVFTGAGDSKKLVIVLNGFVQPIPMGVLEVVPRKIEMGNVKAGAAVPKKITITNTGDATMTITEVASRKYHTVYFKGSIAIAAGKSSDIPISITAAKAGRYLDYLMIHSDARNVTEEGYKLVVTANVQ